MRKIEIQLNDETFTPGDAVEGHVLVTCDNDFRCERLHVTLFGEEVARVVIHAGKVTIVHEDKREHVNVIFHLTEGLTIPMGESRYDFSINLPPDIPGSYKGTYGWIKYRLEAKAEIVRARDLKSKLDFSLKRKQGVDIESIPEPKSGLVEREWITLFKVETDKDHFVLGDNLDFRFLVDREASIRGVRAEVVRQEHVEPKGHKMDSKKKLAEIYFKDDDLRRDSWVEATIQTDSNWTESFTSELIEYRHFLKVTLDIARRRDKVIEIPIVLVTNNNDKSIFDF